MPYIDAWCDVDPEFGIMSLKPGIGKEWLVKYQDEVYGQDKLPIPGRGVFGKPPAYYDEIYEKIDPEKLKRNKEKRREKMAQSLVDGPSLESRALVQDAKIRMLGKKL